MKTKELECVNLNDFLLSTGGINISVLRKEILPIKDE